MTLFGPIGSDSSVRDAARGVPGRALFRADLHVHSRHSGRGHLEIPGVPAGLPDPLAIYHTARARGIDLVTLTDLDTIDGCLEVLSRHPEAVGTDFMISEEVRARDPRTGVRLHVLLYDLSESQHRDAQRLKGDVRDLAAFARREGIVASLGSLGGGLRAAAAPGCRLPEFLALFDCFEIKNGAGGRRQNELMARLAQEAAGGETFGITAGSNAHDPARIGRTLTVSRAAGRAEFVEDLKRHRTWAAGEDGGWRASSAEIGRLIARGYRTHPAAHALLLPLHLTAAPFVGNCVRHAWTDARARRAKRRLDHLVVSRFKEKARTYAI